MAEFSLLFWNVAGKDLRDRVARLASARAPDVLILAENSTPPAEMVAALAPIGTGYQLASDNVSKVDMYARVAGIGLLPLLTSPPGRVTFCQVSVPGVPGLLLVAVHLPSQLHWSRDDQTLFSARLAVDIREFETVVGHTRTVVIGDFNMNPFDPGIAGPAHYTR